MASACCSPSKGPPAAARYSRHAQRFKPWSPLNRLLTHVILVRVERGSNIQQASCSSRHRSHRVALRTGEGARPPAGGFGLGTNAGAADDMPAAWEPCGMKGCAPTDPLEPDLGNAPPARTTAHLSHGPPGAHCSCPAHDSNRGTAAVHWAAKLFWTANRQPQITEICPCAGIPTRSEAFKQQQR